MRLIPRYKTSESESESEMESEIRRLNEKIHSYERLAFESIGERDWYQMRLYGTIFLPQFLRYRVTLVALNIRFERSC